MAIIQAMTASFKKELLTATHDFENDTFKIALYTSSADIGPSTTAYTTSGEVVGTGYTAGGQTVTGITVNLSGIIAYVDFDDVTWDTVTLTAAGALLYNSSKNDKAVAVYSFGGSKSKTASDFTLKIPTADMNNAVIRIA
jgi:hypothetical protein